MEREVVRDFLNLPGIVGVALMNGRSRPFFLGINQSLNFQQKEALSQGIQQVVETTPANFEFFEFQFIGHRVYIYKLERNIILLVLANDDLVYANYSPIVSLLKLELQEDLTRAIANFRLVAGNIALSGKGSWKDDAEASTESASIQAELLTPSPPNTTHFPTPEPSSSDHVPPEQLSDTNGHLPQQISQQQTTTSEPLVPQQQQISQQQSDAHPSSPSSSRQQQLRIKTTPPESDRKSSDNVSCPAKTGNTTDTENSQAKQISLKDILDAQNYLSKTTTRYLGATIVSNYWKSSRPAIEWLNHFEVDRSGQIAWSGSMPSRSPQTLNSEQHQWLREWVAAFIHQCSRVIRDFPSVVQKMELSSNQRNLLLTDNRK